jgi:hypothetical protein
VDSITQRTVKKVNRKLPINLAAILTVLLLSASCVKPDSRYSYIASDNAGPEGRYCFEADLDDSLALYSTEIICRWNTSKIKDKVIDLNVIVNAPDSTSYEENVRLPLNAGSNAIKLLKLRAAEADIQWPYRDKISVGGNTGIWSITITPSKAAAQGITGLGFSYKKQ